MSAQSKKSLIIFIGVLVLLCCLAGSGGLLVFSRYARVVRPALPPLIFPTRDPNPTQPDLLGIPGTPAIESNSGPAGKIVFVCQIFRLQAQDQICIINADGSGWQRLTNTDETRSFYPSLSPDGSSVLFSTNPDGNFKLVELSLSDLSVTPLGDTIGFAPEVSPDNQMVAYTNNSGQTDNVWVMERDGSNPRLLHRDGWDPTWSADSSRVLFATHSGELSQLASIKLDGSDFRLITNLPSLRGRSDWSADGAYIVTYSGDAWKRELYLMNPDGSDLHQITPAGGNSQGPSFSPDGQWVAFTAYFDAPNNNNGCEIYIIRIDGSDLQRLTENKYCDWQPRWGP
jgi:TolB protein